MWFFSNCRTPRPQASPSLHLYHLPTKRRSSIPRTKTPVIRYFQEGLPVDAGKGDSRALRGSTDDYVQEEKSGDDFDQEARRQTIFAWAEIPIAVGSKPRGYPVGLARGDRVENRGGHDCTQDLGNHVWNHVARLKAAACPETDRYRAIEMYSGNMADRISHCQYGQPEGEADPEESDAQRRETRGEHGAAAARKGQPESAEEFGSKTPRSVHNIPPIWMFKRLNTLGFGRVVAERAMRLHLANVGSAAPHLRQRLSDRPA